MKNEEKAQELAFVGGYTNDIGISKVIIQKCCEMAEWKEEQMIEKAVKWLENNVKVNGAFYCFAFKKDDIESFKQAMKGE